MTGPQLRQKVATAVGRHLRANPPEDSNVDNVEAAFAAAIMRTAEFVIRPQGQDEVGMETPKRKLSYRLRLMRCTQRGSA